MDPEMGRGSVAAQKKPGGRLGVLPPGHGGGSREGPASWVRSPGSRDTTRETWSGFAGSSTSTRVSSENPESTSAGHPASRRQQQGQPHQGGREGGGRGARGEAARFLRVA